MTTNAFARPSPRRGYSLFEVILAIALLLALASAMSGFYWDMLSVRRDIIERAAQQRAATMLIEGLERSIASSITGDVVSGAGVRGDNTSVSILTRTVPARLARGGRRTAPFADLERSEYRFEAAHERVTAARTPVSGGGTRAEAELEGRIPRLRFRYHDGRGWRDEFDSLALDRLPLAIEVAIWLSGPAASGAAPADDTGDETDAIDIAAGFDERALAMRGDLDPFERRPDRLRVIAVPDGGGHDDEIGTSEEGGR